MLFVTRTTKMHHCLLLFKTEQMVNNYSVWIWVVVCAIKYLPYSDLHENAQAVLVLSTLEADAATQILLLLLITDSSSRWKMHRSSPANSC